MERSESRVEDLEQEKQFADERIVRLEENLRKRDEEVDKYTERFISGEGEVEKLREEMSKFKRERDRILSEQSRMLNEAIRQKEMMEMNLEEVVRAKVELDLEMKVVKEREGRLVGECEELRKEVDRVKKDSADKEVKMVQIEKRAEREREDLMGLGIALESKQQELELIKRKLGVRGTAGSTPVAGSVSRASTAHHRRDSSVFSGTPRDRERPSSAMSSEDTSSGGVGVSGGKKSLNEKVVFALGRSSRVNGGGPGTPMSTGTMGPPVSTTRLASRPSMNLNGSRLTQTPTPTGKGLTRSSSASFGIARGGITSPTPTAHRRGGSANAVTEGKRMKLGKRSMAVSPSPTSGMMRVKGVVEEAGEVPEANEGEGEEKENVDLTEKIPSPSPKMNSLRGRSGKVPMLS